MIAQAILAAALGMDFNSALAQAQQQQFGALPQLVFGVADFLFEIHGVSGLVFQAA